MQDSDPGGKLKFYFTRKNQVVENKRQGCGSGESGGNAGTTRRAWSKQGYEPGLEKGRKKTG